jgi:nicotinate-nucleotide adenylyltransferase
MSLLGVFGGTFDPVHNGHLRCAWELSEQFEMPIHMIPACQPVHRDRPGAAPEHRLAMLELALAGQNRLLADARELERGGDSYMVDTLDSLRTELPDCTPCLILGMDAFKAIETWHSWQRLFELAHLIVMTRPGEDDSVTDSLAQWINDRWVSNRAALASARSGKVLKASVSRLQVSASAIREQLAAGHHPRYLVPAKVLEYITLQRLYR